MRKLSFTAAGLFLSLACSLGLSASAPQAARAQGGALNPDNEAVFAFLDRYEKRDKTADPAIIDMYADDARIVSEIERPDRPTTKMTYTKAQYAEMIKKSFADPQQVKQSAATVYQDTVVRNRNEKTYSARKAVELGDKLDQKPLSETNEREVEFTAIAGDSAMRVNWLLRKAADGQYRIAAERSLTYRKSIGQGQKTEVQKQLNQFAP